MGLLGSVLCKRASNTCIPGPLCAGLAMGASIQGPLPVSVLQNYSSTGSTSQVM